MKSEHIKLGISEKDLLESRRSVAALRELATHLESLPADHPEILRFNNALSAWPTDKDPDWTRIYCMVEEWLYE